MATVSSVLHQAFDYFHWTVSQVGQAAKESAAALTRMQFCSLLCTHTGKHLQCCCMLLCVIDSTRSVARPLNAHSFKTRQKHNTQKHSLTDCRAFTVCGLTLAPTCLLWAPIKAH